MSGGGVLGSGADGLGMAARSSAPDPNTPQAGGSPSRPRLVVAGNLNVDLLLGPVAPWPEVGTETAVERHELRVGGALGNTALALAGLGEEVSYVSDVGDDLHGDFLREALLGAGVRPGVMRSPTALTVGLFHPDGERTFLSHLGHMASSRPDDLGLVIQGLGEGDLLLLCGTFLLPGWRPALPELLGQARARGATTLLDTGWPLEGWTESVLHETWGILAQVDVFLPNLAEARALTARPAAPLETVAEVLQGRGLQAVVKLGAHGAAWWDGAGLHRAAAPRVSVADTVGAGDAFNAGLLSALRSGRTMGEAVAAAVALASATITSRPRRHPSWREVAEVGVPA